MHLFPAQAGDIQAPIGSGGRARNRGGYRAGAKCVRLPAQNNEEPFRNLHRRWELLKHGNLEANFPHYVVEAVDQQDCFLAR